jgi:hypothetical protein
VVGTAAVGQCCHSGNKLAEAPCDRPSLASISLTIGCAEISTPQWNPPRYGGWRAWGEFLAAIALASIIKPRRAGAGLGEDRSLKQS